MLGVHGTGLPLTDPKSTKFVVSFVVSSVVSSSSVGLITGEFFSGILEVDLDDFPDRDILFYVFIVKLRLRFFARLILNKELIDAFVQTTPLRAISNQVYLLAESN